MGSQPRGISASRGAAILGLSEWSTPFEVWQEIQEERFPAIPFPDGSVVMGCKDRSAKGYPGFNAERGYTLPEHKDGPPLRWGTAFEDSVIQLAEAAQNSVIIERERAFERDGFITCHIDGAYGYPESPLPEEWTLHEGKTTSAFPFREKWGEPGTARIPRTYQVQVQHQMACTGAEMDIVSVLVFPETPDQWEKMGWKPVRQPGPPEYWTLAKEQPDRTVNLIKVSDWAEWIVRLHDGFHQYPVPADRDAQKLLLDAYRHFWDHYVIGEKEPEPRDYEDIKRMFPDPKKTIVCPSNIQSLLAEMKSIKEEIGGSGPLAKKFEQDKLVVLKWAFAKERIEDEDSLDALIFRDQAGNKLASYSRDKRGTYTFRAS